jgi:hypothetical protein
MHPALKSLFLILPLTALAGCVAPTGPVEVTRFHLADTAMLRGTVAVEAAPGMDGGSIELRTFQVAVGNALERAGYRQDGAGAQVAEVRLTRRTYQPERNRSPVSVGLGGSAGSYGSGVGVGVGIDLSGKPAAMTETTLGVMIRDRATRQVVWEGRALFTVRADSPLAATALASAEMARALFADFPGRSGETVLVKAGQ